VTDGVIFAFSDLAGRTEPLLDEISEGRKEIRV
jgi:hypothetical protein